MLDPNSRQNCQYCRFQTCLRSGMRITWVLTDAERKRRFGIVKKSDLEMLKSKSADILLPSTRTSPLYLSFTIEDQKVLDNTHSKFQVPWVQNFLIFNKDSATNLIEFTYGTIYLVYYMKFSGFINQRLHVHDRRGKVLFKIIHFLCQNNFFSESFLVT